eukprot:TRINITY_DN4229_c0_g1_i1.p1 TRINITY_DN4229_c0_g1~~TRINITY_DN4229_c0_g1_i1.p1  ORF type:complete len:136 (+),score=7.85 TRINITY_DN4229_c0_g1_i1:3-410(+)
MQLPTPLLSPWACLQETALSKGFSSSSILENLGSSSLEMLVQYEIPCSLPSHLFSSLLRTLPLCPSFHNQHAQLLCPANSVCRKYFSLVNSPSSFTAKPLSIKIGLEAFSTSITLSRNTKVERELGKFANLCKLL